jgi:hypothetical protein
VCCVPRRPVPLAHGLLFATPNVDKCLFVHRCLADTPHLSPSSSSLVTRSLPSGLLSPLYTLTPSECAVSSSPCAPSPWPCSLRIPALTHVVLFIAAPPFRALYWLPSCRSLCCAPVCTPVPLPGVNMIHLTSRRLPRHLLLEVCPVVCCRPSTHSLPLSVLCPCRPVLLAHGLALCDSPR